MSKLTGILKPKSDIVFSKSIELRDISYKYPDKDSYVLENSSLKINKGEKILIKGKTGSPANLH